MVARLCSKVLLLDEGLVAGFASAQAVLSDAAVLAAHGLA
jgi:hypothetical protein